jgi:hypothetical protein
VNDRARHVSACGVSHQQNPNRHAHEQQGQHAPDRVGCGLWWRWHHSADHDGLWCLVHGLCRCLLGGWEGDDVVFGHQSQGVAFCLWPALLSLIMRPAPEGRLKLSFDCRCVNSCVGFNLLLKNKESHHTQNECPNKFHVTPDVYENARSALSPICRAIIEIGTSCSPLSSDFFRVRPVKAYRRSSDLIRCTNECGSETVVDVFCCGRKIE